MNLIKFVQKVKGFSNEHFNGLKSNQFDYVPRIFLSTSVIPYSYWNMNWRFNIFHMKCWMFQQFLRKHHMNFKNCRKQVTCKIDVSRWLKLTTWFQSAGFRHLSLLFLKWRKSHMKIMVLSRFRWYWFSWSICCYHR